MALAKGKEVFAQVVKDDTGLLDHFGLQLLSVSGCLRAAKKDEVKQGPKGPQINPWNVVEINMKTWDWLRPLLLELREQQEENGGELGELMIYTTRSSGLCPPQEDEDENSASALELAAAK